MFWFSLAAGAPVLVWSAFGGGDSDLSADAEDGGGIMSVIPLSTLAFVSAFFGITGLAVRQTGAGPVAAVLLALAVGVAAGVLNSAVFAWLRRTGVSSDVTDKELEGAIARVVMPVSARRRGRIVLDIAGSESRMTAAPVDDGPGGEIEAGAQVIVVKVEGGVARVTRLAPELAEIDDPRR